MRPAARRSNDGAVTIVTPSAASAFAAAIDTRIPVKLPGPSATATVDTSRAVAPSRPRTSSIIGSSAPA